MRIAREIRKRIRHESANANVVGDVNAVIAANVNEPGARTSTSSRSKVRIVQRSGSPATVEVDGERIEQPSE